MNIENFSFDLYVFLSQLYIMDSTGLYLMI